MIDEFGHAKIGDVKFQIGTNEYVVVEMDDYLGSSVRKYVSLVHLEQFVKEARKWVKVKTSVDIPLPWDILSEWSEDHTE